MLFRDGRMVSGQQNPEGDANGRGGEADATLSRKLVANGRQRGFHAALAFAMTAPILSRRFSSAIYAGSVAGNPAQVRASASKTVSSSCRLLSRSGAATIRRALASASSEEIDDEALSSASGEEWPFAKMALLTRPFHESSQGPGECCVLAIMLHLRSRAEAFPVSGSSEAICGRRA